LQNFQILVFRIEKSIISLPPMPPAKMHISIYQCVIF